MPRKKIIIEEMEFPRSFSFSSPTHTVSGTLQPYITGMYVAINDSQISELVQLSLGHKQVKKWYLSLEKAMKKMGMKGDVQWRKYTDFLPIEEMEKYEIFK